LRSCARLLAPGGMLFLRTPNLAYVLPLYTLRRRIFRHRAAVLGPTNHVVYFTAHSLRRALTAVGLGSLEFPVFPPPQIAVSDSPLRRFNRESSMSVRLKNAWAGLAGLAAERTGGRIVLGADLDVIAQPAGRPPPWSGGGQVARR
jgi:hypothetical protein